MWRGTAARGVTWFVAVVETDAHLIAGGATGVTAVAAAVILRADRATTQTTHIFELCCRPESRDAAVKRERDNPSTATMLLRWLGYRGQTQRFLNALRCTKQTVSKRVKSEPRFLGKPPFLAGHTPRTPGRQI